MKKIIILFVVWSLSTFALLLSCDSMNDIYQKYVDAGERVYLGMTDSVASFPGVGRVKLVWYVCADSKMETTVIFWNNRLDSLEKQFTRTHEGVQKDSVIIEGLSEGLYNFELVNKNVRGERSLTATVQGRSYGEVYASGFGVRQVAGLSCIGFNPVAQSSSVKITWDEAPEGCTVKIAYKKRTTGEEVVVYTDESESETILTDVGNRLGHSDDVLDVSATYILSGCIDPIVLPVQKEHLVVYMASGTRIENTLFEGTDTTIMSAYVQQDKILRMVMTDQGERLIFCNRVAETSPLTIGNSFRMTLNDDQTVSVGGNYAGVNPISNTPTKNSVYNPVTGNFTMQYTVKTAGGYYIVEETLVPKTTPFEMEAAKPFGDMRTIIPGDNTSYGNAALYPFSSISDGLWGPFLATPNAFLTANVVGNPMSITVDLNQPLKLSRMILYPLQRMATARNDVYSIGNVSKCEIWGTAVLDESKLSDAAYWVDATDPSGIFKEDWVFLGFHEIERLDKKNATDQEIIDRGIYGHQFFIPESAGPVRYIRFYNRETINNGMPYSNPAYFYIGELTFFGYAQ